MNSTISCLGGSIPPSLGRHRGIVLPALVISLATLLQVGMLTRGHNWGGDFASYIMQAKSLAEGDVARFVAENRDMLENSSSRFCPVAYPWGYPLMLAPLYALVGFNLMALKMVGLASYTLFLIVLWRGFIRFHGHWDHLALVCLFAFHPVLLNFCNHILSDIPFLVVSTCAVLLIRSLVGRGRALEATRGLHAAIGVVLAAALALRTTALVLLPTLVVVHVVELRKALRERTPAGQRLAAKLILTILSSYVVFLVACGALALLFPDSGASYTQQWNSISGITLRQNAGYYFLLPAEYFRLTYKYLLYGATVPLLVVGTMKRWRRDYPFVVYGLFIYLLHVAWPAKQDWRFIFPVLPFFWSFVLSGIDWVAHWARGPAGFRKALAAFPLLLATGLLVASVNHVIRIRTSAISVPDGPQQPEAQEMFEYVRQQVGEGDVVVFFKPMVMRLYTGKTSVKIDTISDVRVLQGKLGRRARIYLCSYESKGQTYPIAAPEVLQAMEAGLMVESFRNSRFRLFRIQGENGPST